MYENLIKNYIKKITKKDIINYAKKENINISNDETDIIFYYIKNYYNDILKDPNKYLKIAEEKLSKEIYEKLLEIKKKYKN